MSSVNETIGAHDGAVTAIVTASLTPISAPASSGASARPRPPSITAAKTTPIHAYICDGASVKLSARQTPATLASAEHVPASTSAMVFSLTPKAEAIGRILGGRAQRPAEIGVAQHGPDRDREATESSSVISSGIGT